MFNAGVRGKRAKDGVGFLSTAEQFNQKSFLVPTVTSFSITDVSYVPLDNTAVDTAGGEIIVINGSGFASGATVQVGATTIGSVTFVDQNRLAFSAPALSSGSYTIYVTNSNGGTGILLSGLVYSGLPTFTTTAGTLGTVYETANINTAVVATGDAPITYTLLSGTLPAGANINSNGTITGTAPVDGSSTTYSFTIQASDGQLQDSTRAFTLTINTDVLSWGLANNTVYALDGGVAMSNVTLTATSSANSNSAVTFAANTLPTGVSLSDNTIFGTPTVDQTVYTAVTATATQTGRTATRFVSWVVQLADVFWKYNTLAIQGASTTFLDDASTNNFAATITGDIKPNSFNPYSPGYYSNNFDGTGDYLSFPNNAVFAFGTGSYTIEFWINGPLNNDKFILGGRSAIGTMHITTGGSSSTAGVLRYVGSSTIVSSNVITDGTWHHCAIVRNGSSNITLYVDGVSVGTGTDTTNYTSTSGTWYIASNDVGISNNPTAYISNLRIVKGTAVYTSNFTPSTTPLAAIANTSLLTCQSNRFIDTSTNAFTVTVGGNPIVNSFGPFVPNSNYSTYGSTYFNDSAAYINIPNNAAFAFGTADFTIEFWVHTTDATGGLVSQGVTGGWATTLYSNTLYWQSSWNQANLWTFTATSITNGAWHHLAFSRASGSTKFFIDGVLVATNADTTNYSVTSGSLIIGRDGNPADFKGYMTDVRVVKGTAIYTAAFTPPTAPLTAIANTSLLTLQNNQPVNNNRFLDNSTNNFLIDRYGNATQGTFSPYGGNWSNYFDGSGDYLSIANNSAFNQNSAFTVECWVNSSAGGYFFTQLNSGYLGLNYTADTRKIQVDKSFVGVQITSTNSFSFNQWHHVAMSYDGTTTRLFVNGALEGSVAGGGVASNTDTRIGNYNTGSNFYTGYISNFRVSNTGLYTSAFTPSTTPLIPTANTKFLTCADNRLIDDSINNLTITKAGDVTVQRFSPFSPSSITPTSYSGYFDGTGDYLTLPDSNIWAVSGDFTIEAWLYPTSLPNESCIFAVWQGGTISNTSLNFNVQTNGRLSFTGAVNNTQYTVTGTTTTIIVNTWSHVAVVRSGTTVSLYVNGVADASTVTMAGTVNNLSPGPSIGSLNSGGAGFTSPLNGTISNLRLVTSAVYTANFTPSTTPLTAIANTILLTCQSPTFIDNSTNNFTISAFGNSKPTQQNPFGFTSATTNGYTPSTIGGSGYFDGTGDYLSLPESSTPLSTTSSFTLDAWVFPTSTADATIFYILGNATSFAGIRVGLVSSTAYVLHSQNGTTWAVNSGNQGSVPINAWSHIAVTRNVNAGTLWINGTSVYTFTFGTLFSGPVKSIGANQGGGGASGLFTGYITDARVVNGNSIYTSNFVPPASPLQAITNTSWLTNMTSAGIYDAATMTPIETVGDAKLSTAISKFGGTSMSFNGSTDWLSVPNITNLRFGTGDFTVELWAYWNSPVADAGFVGGTSQGSMDFAYTGSTLRIGRIDTSWDSTFSSWTPTANVWYHIAFTRNNGIARAFVDGVQIGSNSGNTNTYTPVGPLLVGKSSGNDRRLNGYIDDLRITKGYARYTANFTPPAGSFKIK
jgi:hypothetical protein